LPNVLPTARSDTENSSVADGTGGMRAKLPKATAG
jgi:hypothetical protein